MASGRIALLLQQGVVLPRVLLHDRRNCGYSDVVIDGEKSEQEIWAADLAVLLRKLDAHPVIAGGGSAGCRLSLLLAMKHPNLVRGLLLWHVTGGEFAAKSLGEGYYGQYIELARQGGMQQVCNSDFFAERILQNPSNRDRLMSRDVEDFIEVMNRWRTFFNQGADLPVIGASEENLRGIDLPVCIVPVTIKFTRGMSLSISVTFYPEQNYIIRSAKRNEIS